MNSQTAEADRYQITLVHGTFAKGTAWTQDGSSLRRALSQSLSGSCMNVFEWSGRNTHRARLQAGRQLAAFLDAIALRDPQAKQIVITHSHGGNVALYAGHHIKNPSSLSRIVFLATPFIVCGAANGVAGHAWVRALVSGMLSIIITAILRGVFLANGPDATDEYWFNISPEDEKYYEVMFFIEGVIFCTIFAILFFLISAYVRRLAARQLARLRWPRLDQLDILSISYKMDEAATYLSYLNWATTGISRFIWRLLGWGAGFLLSFLMLIFVIYWAILLQQHVMPNWTPAGWVGFGLSKIGEVVQFVLSRIDVIADGYGLMFLILVPAAYLLQMARGNPLGYGWEKPSATIFVDIKADIRPKDLHTTRSEFIEFDIGRFKKANSMAHTTIYDDPRVQDKIVDWIIRATRQKPNRSREV